MFTLIKLVIDLAVAIVFFVGGVKVAVKYPDFAAKINSFVSWAKSEI
jgi:hypothetical protein